ncbi:MAG: HD domain-containing protein, partial [Lachnospiraceae bacterium]|nr:HD domain-containing protein [Lachnospiraceae bacterium]
MDARDTLLLACETSGSREALRSLFEDSFNLLEADNSHQARLFMEQNYNCIAAVILDITVPSKINRGTLHGIEKISLSEDIPIVVISKDNDSDAIVTIFERGATDVYPPDCDPYVLQHRVHNIVELYRHKWHLQELVEEQSAILRHSNDAMVDALSSIIEYRSVESGQHILRIRRFTQILLEEISRSCPEYKLTDATIRIISSASALHDVGKISIPDSILNKPGNLTEEEWEVMKSHSITGCRILESLSDVGNQEYLRYAHNIAHYHHERWDGSGYPEGLAGDTIPICAQVVGLADAYDALTSKRVYKDAYSFERALNMILNGDCGAFSPKVLECFKQVSGKFEQLAQSYADGCSPKADNFDVTLPGPVQQADQNTLQAVQAKYQSMLHYANATVAEVDLDQGLFHLVYNPDP